MRRVWYIIMLLAVLGSCSKAGTEQREMVTEFVGKQIEFPEGLKYQIQDMPVSYDPEDADYRIIVYIDSIGCAPCRMKLPLWHETVSDFRALRDVEVSFAMILGSAPSTEMINILKKEDFRHPVCFDADGAFAKANRMPTDEKYNTFLLDKNNEVIAIGNPATNPKVEALYMKMIGREGPTGLCPNPAKAMGIVTARDTIRQRFMLRNRGEGVLTVERIVPSCHCTSGTASADSIAAGESMTMEMAYVADSIAGPFHQYLDVFFKEREEPERLSLHGFIKDKSDVKPK